MLLARDVINSQKFEKDIKDIKKKFKRYSTRICLLELAIALNFDSAGINKLEYTKGGSKQ